MTHQKIANCRPISRRQVTSGHGALPKLDNKTTQSRPIENSFSKSLSDARQRLDEVLPQPLEGNADSLAGDDVDGEIQTHYVLDEQRWDISLAYGMGNSPEDGVLSGASAELFLQQVSMGEARDLSLESHHRLLEQQSASAAIASIIAEIQQRCRRHEWRRFSFSLIGVFDEPITVALERTADKQWHVRLTAGNANDQNEIDDMLKTLQQALLKLDVDQGAVW